MANQPRGQGEISDRAAGLEISPDAVRAGQPKRYARYASEPIEHFGPDQYHVEPGGREPGHGRALQIFKSTKQRVATAAIIFNLPIPSAEADVCHLRRGE